MFSHDKQARYQVKAKRVHSNLKTFHHEFENVSYDSSDFVSRVPWDQTFIMKDRSAGFALVHFL